MRKSIKKYKKRDVTHRNSDVVNIYTIKVRCAFKGTPAEYSKLIWASAVFSQIFIVVQTHVQQELRINETSLSNKIFLKV